MTNPYGPPSGPQPQQPYGNQPYGPHSGPQPMQPYGQPAYGPPSAGLPQQPYGQPGYPPMQFHPFGQPAEWGTRALGYLVDVVAPTVAFYVVYFVAFVVGGASAASGASDGAVVITIVAILGIAGLALTAFQIWNLCYRRGTTGQTLGQKVAKIKTISEEHGRPLGFGNAFLRQLCHFVDSIACYVGWFAPLWDEKKQTWADKIMRSVVVRVDQPVPGAGPYGGYGQPGPYPAPGTPGGMPPQPGYGPPQQW